MSNFKNSINNLTGNDRAAAKAAITELLALDDFTPVYEMADRVRKKHVGDTVHLRAIIEFSNVCKRQCRYCGLNRENHDLQRFRMSPEEIVETARRAVAAGYRTIVLQSGEDEWFTPERLGAIIEEIKAMQIPENAAANPECCQTAYHAESSDSYEMCSEMLNIAGNAAGDFEKNIAESGAKIGNAKSDNKSGSDVQLWRDKPNGIGRYAADSSGNLHPAVTVSCGEMSRKDYEYLRSKGADRYLLKHETADPVLYSRFHPCGSLENRINCLKTIHDLGYETGSGFMVGLPGQTLETIAEDLLLLKEIPCQMAGIGPFISNPKTPLAGEKNGDTELTRRAVAIARLLLPEANLPVTTALSILTSDEQAEQESYDDGKINDRIKNETYRTGDAVGAGSGASSASADKSFFACGKSQLANPFAFGANVVMKKVTPDEYKQAYEIYPAEFKKTDISGDRQELEEIIRSCGRVPL